MKYIILFLIRIYQKTLSPDHSWVRFLRKTGACKFRPTCSEYSYDAIQRYGVARGGRMSLKRLIKCNPFSRGGWEPVK